MPLLHPSFAIAILFEYSTEYSDEGHITPKKPFLYPDDSVTLVFMMEEWHDPDEDFIEELPPRWTWWRLLYLLIALLMIAALLAASFWPLLAPPEPPYIPTTPPASL